MSIIHDFKSIRSRMLGEEKPKPKVVSPGPMVMPWNCLKCNHPYIIVKDDSVDNSCPACGAP